MQNFLQILAYIFIVVHREVLEQKHFSIFKFYNQERPFYFIQFIINYNDMLFLGETPFDFLHDFCLSSFILTWIIFLLFTKLIDIWSWLLRKVGKLKSL
jgi:hypothetical protein